MLPGKHPFVFLVGGLALLGIVFLLFADTKRQIALQPPVVYVGINDNGILTGASQSSQNASDESSLTTILALPASTSNPMPSSASMHQDTTVTVPAGSTRSPQTPTPSSLSGNQLLKDVYSLIPTGLPTAGPAKTRGSAQQALFDYGNEAGLVVLTFESSDPDMSQVLKDWLANRTDSSKIAAVNKIADDMAAAGEQLRALPNVPSSAAGANASLADAYINAAAKLRAVAQTGSSDSALVQAIKLYDSTADGFTTSFITLSTVFSLNNVTFSQADTGNAFSFSAAGL